MTVQSGEQPLCRTCGKPIAKATRTIYFEDPTDRGGSHTEGEVQRGQFSDTVWTTNPPRTRDEAKRHTNGQIISAKRGSSGGLSQVAVWDGESYQDDLFCTVRCAEALGRAAARAPHNLVLPAYNAAIRGKAAT